MTILDSTVDMQLQELQGQQLLAITYIWLLLLCVFVVLQL